MYHTNLYILVDIRTKVHCEVASFGEAEKLLVTGNFRWATLREQNWYTREKRGEELLLEQEEHNK